MRGLVWILIIAAVGVAAWLLLAGGGRGLDPAGRAGADARGDAEQAELPHLVGTGRRDASERDESEWTSGWEEVRVRVVAADGSPLSGIRLELIARERPPTHPSTDPLERGRARHQFDPRSQKHERIAVGESGEDGRFVFEGVRNYSQLRVVAAPSAPLCRAEARVPGSWNGRQLVPEILLTLLEGSPLAVRVVDADGKGVPAVVSWSAAVPGRPSAPSVESGARATDAAGRLALARVPTGLVGLTAFAPGVGQVSGVTARVPHEGEVELVLGQEDPAVIFGNILRPDGTPVPHPTVWLQTTSQRPPFFRSHHEVSGDAEGRYEIMGVGGDAIATLGVSAPAHATRYSLHRNRPFERGTRTRIDILLPLGGTVTGTVMDEAGAPLAGARVFAHPRNASQLGRWDLPVVVTDADGRYRIEGLPPGKGQLGVALPGYQRMARDGPPTYDVTEPGSSQTVDVVLLAGGRIVGTVLDPTGSPAAGATVELGTRRGAGWFDFQRHVAAKQTGADGRFELDGFDPTRDWLLRAHSLTGYSEDVTWSAGSEGEPELSLRPGIEVRGRVLIGDKPPREAVRVRVSLERGRLERRLQTDEGGAFLARGLPPGAAEVWLDGLGSRVPREPRRGTRESLTRRQLELVAGSQPEPVLFELPLLGDIAGRLLDPEGKPIARFLLRLEGDAKARIPHQHTRSDAEGHFRFRQVLDRAWTLVAGATEQGPVRVGTEGLVVTTARPNPHAASPGTVIHGTVLLPGGSLLAQGTCLVLSADGHRRLASAAVQDGSFQFRIHEALPPVLRMQVQEPRDLLGRRPNVLDSEVEVPTGALPLVVRLEKGFRIAGRVLDEAGQPHDQPWCQVRLRPVMQPGKPRREAPDVVRLSTSGDFVFDGLEPGTWTLDVMTDGSPFKRPKPLEVRSGDEDIEIRLVRGAVIRGRVEGPDGQPLAHALVMFQPLRPDGRSETPMLQAMTREDGSYEVGGIKAGARGTLFVRPPMGHQHELVPISKEDVTSPSAGHSFRLSRGVYIEGRLEPGDGAQKLPHTFQVHARPVGAGAAQPVRAQGAGLAFRLGPVLAGEYELQVALDRRRFPTQPRATVRAPARGVVLHVDHGRQLRVHIDHEDADSFHLQWLPAVQAGSLRVEYPRRDESGAFVWLIAGDEAGTVFARHEAHGLYALLRGARPSAGPYTLTPQRGASISGMLTGTTIESVLVRCTGPVNAWGYARASRGGAFEIKGLPPGRYDLSVDLPTGRAVREGVDSGATGVTLAIQED